MVSKNGNLKLEEKFSQARQLYKKNKFEELCDWLNLYIKNNPSDGHAYLFLATVLFGMGEPEKSKLAEEKAYEVDPNCREEFDKFSLSGEIYDLSPEEEKALREALDLPDESEKRDKKKL